MYGVWQLPSQTSSSNSHYSPVPDMKALFRKITVFASNKGILIFWINDYMTWAKPSPIWSVLVQTSLVWNTDCTLITISFAELDVPIRPSAHHFLSMRYMATLDGEVILYLPDIWLNYASTEWTKQEGTVRNCRASTLHPPPRAPLMQS